jgi:hypothetical protein
MKNGDQADAVSTGPEWLTPDFYARAYDRFIRLRWNIDPFPGEDHHLDPLTFELSSDEINNIGLIFFAWDLINLSSHRLTGQINGFDNDLFKLKAWARILPDYDDKQQLHLMDEFVEPLLMACLIAPYAVKNQIIFAGTQIAVFLERGQCQTRVPSDRDIKNISDLEEWAGNWVHFQELKTALNSISDREFMNSTKDFRHRYTHRMPPRIGMGIVPNFRLEREGSGLRIYPHLEEPLELSPAIEAAVIQHRACVAAFRAFWTMLKAKLASMRSLPSRDATDSSRPAIGQDPSHP